MKIGFLILCHIDPVHIGRLCTRLCKTEDFSVWVHVDKKADDKPFRQAVEGLSNVHFIEDRQDCKWGRFGAVRAELLLLAAGLEAGCGRLVLLQGLDYPLRTNREIVRFFEAYPDTEFLRACQIAREREPCFADKCRKYWILNDRLYAKAWNKCNEKLPLYLRSGVYREKGREYACCWGSAQWALTGECAGFILKFVGEHPGFCRYFSHVFTCDETFFATIVHNSEYSGRTWARGTEKAKKNLVNWRNLHYFEYPKEVRVFEEKDYGFLKGRRELFVRKVCTEKSGGLLDRLDRLDELDRENGRE